MYKFYKTQSNVLPEQPTSLFWIEHENLKFKPQKESHKIMKIFAQSKIIFTPKENKTIRLNFGIDFTSGSASISANFVSLAVLNSHLAKPNSDIVVQMFNTSNESVEILEGSELCKVIYHN